MKPSRKSSDDVRKRILEASLDLFSDKGFHATTTRKIAQKSGVNEVTLFRHFNNKKTLFQEVLNEITQIGFDSRWLDGLVMAPDELLRVGVNRTFELIENHPREVRLLNYALLDGVEGFEENFMGKNLHYAIWFLTETFKKLQDQNLITSKENPEILAQMLLCQMIEMATQRVVRKVTPLKKYDRDLLCNAIIRLFLS